ncbi:putative solute-binding protein family 3/ domain of MltF [Helianthus debilis subsp. tardiflorus]
MWKNETDKPLLEKYTGTFNVCVPKKVAFHEFVDVDNNDQLKGGFSVAIFCLALQELPFKIQPIFKPPEIEDYTEIVQKLDGKNCNAVAADITITSNRTKYADFTIPYMGSELYMLVPAIENWGIETLFKPFTMKLWFAIIISCIIIGIAIEFLEYREKNPIFYHAPFFQKLFMIIWFPISEVFFQKGEIINKCSKVVLVTWLTVIFIVIQIYTASLSTWLTVNQLQPKVPKVYGKVGYQSGSYVVDFIHANLPDSEAIALSSLDDYKNALKKGKVDAICDEVPYIDIFLAKYGDTYKKFGPVADEPGLAFVSLSLSHFISVSLFVDTKLEK